MSNKYMIKLDDIEKKNNFKTPDNYFDNFEDKFDNYLNIRIERKENTSLFKKITPYIYVAASFIAMYFIGTFIVENAIKHYNSSKSELSEINYFSDFNLEQYYTYCLLDDYSCYDIFEIDIPADNNSEFINEYLSQLYTDYELIIE